MTSDGKKIKDEYLVDVETIKMKDRQKIRKRKLQTKLCKNKFIELGFTEDEIKMINSQNCLLKKKEEYRQPSRQITVHFSTIRALYSYF